MLDNNTGQKDVDQVSSDFKVVLHSYLLTIEFNLLLVGLRLIRFIRHFPRLCLKTLKITFFNEDNMAS